MKNMLLIALTIIFLPRSGHCYSYEAYKNLMDSLLSNYDKNIRPVSNQNDAVDFYLGIRLASILELDEVRQVISVNAYCFYTWTDQRMVWNESDHNISLLNPTTDLLWHPNIDLANSATGNPTLIDTSTYVQPLGVRSNGTVSWLPEINMQTYCKLIMTKFPYDSHTCTFVLYQVMYTLDQFKITPITNEVNMGSYTPNGEWEVTGSSLQSLTFEAGGSNNTYLALNLTVQRRPRFFVLNLLFPTCALSFLNILVFILPADSGEKIGYSITVLLSVMLLMSASTAILPPTSEVVPLMTQYLTSLTVISILSVVATVFILIVHHNSEKEENRENVILSTLNRWKTNIAMGISNSKKAHQRPSQIAPSNGSKLNEMSKFGCISDGRSLASEINDNDYKRDDNTNDDLTRMPKGDDNETSNTDTLESDIRLREPETKSAVINMSNKVNKGDFQLQENKDKRNDFLRCRIPESNSNNRIDKSKLGTAVESSTLSEKPKRETFQSTTLDTIFFLVFLIVWCSVTIGYMMALFT